MAAFEIWKPFTYGGRTFMLDDVIHDIATLWDVTNGEENGIKVAEFSDFTLSRSSAVASIFKTIDDYLERRAS